MRVSHKITFPRFEVFMVVKIQVKVFWVVMSCPLKSWYCTTILHGVTTQKTSAWNSIC